MMNRLGKWLPCPLVSVTWVKPWVPSCDSLIVPVTVFGMPFLLKRKANEISVDAAPLPSQPPPPCQPFPPPPIAKCPRCDREIVNWMHGLLRMGARQMDTL